MSFKNKIFLSILLGAFLTNTAIFSDSASKTSTHVAPYVNKFTLESLVGENKELLNFFQNNIDKSRSLDNQLIQILTKISNDDERNRYISFFADELYRHYQNDYKIVEKKFIQQQIRYLGDEIRRSDTQLSDITKEKLLDVYDAVCRPKSMPKNLATNQLGKFEHFTYKLSEFNHLSQDKEMLSRLLDEVNYHRDQNPMMMKLFDYRETLKKARDMEKENLFLTGMVELEGSQRLALVGNPLKDSTEVKRYWEMIAETKAPLIITLCSASQSKSIQPFWKEETIKEAKVPATLISKKVLYKGNEWISDDGIQAQVSIVERKFQLQTDSGKHTVTHLHYIHWPDHEPAPDIQAFKTLMKQRDVIVQDKNQVIAINCHGGIGRTGEVALYEILRGKIDAEREKGKDLNSITLNLAEAIYELRLQQPGVVGKNATQLQQLCALIFDYYTDLRATNK